MQNERYIKRIGPGKLILVLLTVIVAACTSIYQNHGYTPPDEDLAKVTVGKDTRESVAEAVGSPLYQSLQRDTAWYYVSSRRETYGTRKPRVISREIVSIRFTDSGRVENIERFSEQDGQVIRLSSRVTDPAVSDAGFLRQVFGRLGTITADNFLQ